MFAGPAVEKLAMLPSEYVKRNVWYGNIMYGAEVTNRDAFLDRFMWGADFPHHEGTVPNTLAALRATVNEVPEPELRQFLAGNAAALYGADLTDLQEVADRIGFTPEQIARPISLEDCPDDPNFHVLCASSGPLKGLGMPR
jgi:hypothetical protein